MPKPLVRASGTPCFSMIERATGGADSSRLDAAGQTRPAGVGVNIHDASYWILFTRLNSANPFVTPTR